MQTTQTMTQGATPSADHDKLAGVIASLTASVMKGNLTARADAAQFEGSDHLIVQNINAMLDTMGNPLSTMSTHLERLAKGDVPEKITETYTGQFDRVKTNINQCIDAINSLTDEASTMAAAAAAGDLDKRADPRQFDGAWKGIIKGLNDTAEGMIVPVRDISDTLNKMAAGDLKSRVEAEYKGDYNVLKVACNELGDQLQGVQDVLRMLKTSAVAGNLDARGDSQRFKGDIAGMVQGFNDVLDAVIGPLNVAAEYIERLSRGSIPGKVIDEYQGDFNEIKNNLNMLIDSLQGLTHIAHAIANGDMSITITKRSDEDVLSSSFQHMIDVIGQLVSEMGTLTQSASEGKLDTRGNVNAFQGDFAKIVRGVNATLDAVIQPLNVAAEYVDRIASGNIPGRITDDYKGDFNEIKNNVNRCVDAINGLVSETTRLTAAAVKGQLDIRGNAEKFEGDFAKIVKGLNATMDAVIKPMNVAAEYIERISNGNIPEQITDEYKGDFNEIKNNLNRCISVINGLVAETIRLTGTATEGKLDVRGDADKFQGEFARIIHGMNATLDAVVGPLNVAAEYMERIANGNIPGKITDIYKGDFNEIKNNLNKNIDAMSGLVTETIRLTGAAAEGKLDVRGDVSQFQGDFAKIIQGLNDTMDAVVGPLNVAAEYIDRIASGEVPDKITEDLKGDFNEIKNNMNGLIESLQDLTTAANAIASGDMSVHINQRSDGDVLVMAFQRMSQTITRLVEEMKRLEQAAVEGRLDTRGQSDQFDGDFGNIVQGVNATLDALINPLNVAAEYIDRIAGGEIPDRIEDDYQGDFNEIKTNLNKCIENIMAVITETTNMAQAAVKGDLDTRVDVSKFEGDWQTIVKGMNDTADGMVVPLRDIGGVLNRMAGGELKARVTAEYQGDYTFLKTSCNGLGDQLQGVQEVLEDLKIAAVEGRLDARGDVGQFKGEISGMVVGLNDVLDAIIGPLNVAAEYIERIGRGNIPDEITENYNGDFNEIKNNLNLCIKNINLLVSEVGSLTTSAAAGNLDQRADVSNFEGDWALVVKGLNDVLDAVIGPLNVAAEYIDRLAKGDIPGTITETYHGDFNEIKHNLNMLIDAMNDVTRLAEAMAAGNFSVSLKQRSDEDVLVQSLNAMKESVQNVVKETSGLIQMVQEGKLDSRGNPANFDGSWREIVEGLNAMIEAFALPINVIAEYIDRIAHGDIPDKITEQYKGDFNEVKNNLNQCIDAIRSMVQETVMLTQAAAEGKLDVRGDAKKFGGDYARIVTGMNNTLNAVIGPLNIVAEYVDRISKGDVPEKIREDYKGDFNEVKNSMNTLIDSTNAVTTLAKEIAEGNLMVAVEKRSAQDELMRALEKMILYLQDIADVSEKISEGDLRVDVKPKSNKDMLNQSMSKMVRYIQEVADVAQKLSSGDVQQEVKPRSDRDVLNKSLADTIIYLKEMAILAEKLAVGEIQVDVRPRSDRDQLSHAFAKSVQYIRDVADITQKLAEGDVQVRVQLRSEQDVLNRGLIETITYLKEMAGLAEKLSVGDVQVQVKPRSESDLLGHAFGKSVQYIRTVADVAEKVSNKDLQVQVKPLSEKDILNLALKRMVENIGNMMTEIENTVAEVQQQNWLRTGQAELNNTMRGEQEASTLAKNIITYLSKYIKAQVGIMYLANGEHDNINLEMAGSYAYNKRKGNQISFGLGEGLVGQAAAEKESILFSEVPDDYMMVSSGIGKTTPRNVLVSPFLYEGQLKGVIELGTVHEFNDQQMDFLKQASENIAIAFNTAQARGKMQELLHATQQQAEELQQQQEQLRVNNEELEAQTRALQESEKRLQQQQSELQDTNKELGQQTKELEQQREEMQHKNIELGKAQHLVEEKAKDLEISSKYKSEFLANMSHELRTPLNSMLILSKLLKDNKEGNLTAKQTQSAGMINQAGAELLSLINEVLDLSKVEAGKMDVNIEPMNLNSLGQYVKQHFTHMAEEKGLYLEVNLADGLPLSVHTDRQRIEQIVKNFLSNAFKFTEKGGITFSIGRPDAKAELSRSGLNPRKAIAIAITDTGVGIPEEKQRLIFEAFQQADGTTSRKFGGTGLGLSISRELSKLLGGEIQLRSKDGEGSTFILYLPEVLSDGPNGGVEEPTNLGARTSLSAQGARTSLSAQGADIPVRASNENKAASPPRADRDVRAPIGDKAASPPPADKDVRASNRVPGGGIEGMTDDREETTRGDRSMLIVEDDPKFARILFDLAREKGYKALIAGDGAAGLQLAYYYIPSAILLDIGLPGMDGWMVMDKLKANPETSKIPVHIISGQDKSREAMEMGAIGYLTKPVSMDEINQAFQTFDDKIPHSMKNLLIVEDDEITRNSMIALLGSKNGTEITTAATGKDALALLQGEPRFDCMVMDLKLPDITGFTLLDKIKADTTIAPIPTIIYTAKDLTKKQQAQLKDHSDVTIIKGLKSEERLLDEVMLFLHQVDSTLSPEEQEKLRLQMEKDNVLEGKKVLLVDDDMRNVYALANVFEDKGLNVLVAENGKEALKQLEEHTDIDLVLMDIMMPEMDGYETTRNIRKTQQFNRLPIIALTAKAMKGDRQKCLEAGANDYLSKPIDTDKLFSLMRVWLY